MSAPRLFLDGRVTLHAGDCLDVLDTLAESSIDSCVCDPPYHLTSIVKRFGGGNAAPAQHGTDGAFSRASRGFMGKTWDGGDVAFQIDTWRKVFRVLKPGAHLVAFAAPKNQHRMISAIEDAGFEVRDCLMWVFGSGFPKSLNVSKAIDQALGRERDKVRIPAAQVRNAKAVGGGRDGVDGAARPFIEAAIERGYHEAVSDEAVSMAGFGTALKPAYEPICLARKPVSEKSIAANVLRWGTGALNVDGCRVGTDGGGAGAGAVVFSDGLNGTFAKPIPGLGRWPANLVHDGSPEVLAAFPDAKGMLGALNDPNGSFGYHGGGAKGRAVKGTPDSGSAARFFYAAKADADDRLGSRHPTVKPIDLMQWLVRLVTPPGGCVLDCFAGTGTTAEAAYREGMRAVLIEREPEYLADIEKRMALILSGKDERGRATAKRKHPNVSAGPLFGDGAPQAGGGADGLRPVCNGRTIGPIGLKR